MVSRLCDDGVQGRDSRCVENSSCFQIFLFVPVCILLLGSPAGLICYFSTSLFSLDSFFPLSCYFFPVHFLFRMFEVAIYLFPLAFGSGKDSMMPTMAMATDTKQQPRTIFAPELFGP